MHCSLKEVISHFLLRRGTAIAVLEVLIRKYECAFEVKIGRIEEPAL